MFWLEALGKVIGEHARDQSLSGASNCTTPAVNGTGTISCPIGNLAASGSGSFTVTVKINNGATGTITNGNYSITAVDSSPLIGAKVRTSVIAPDDFR